MFVDCCYCKRASWKIGLESNELPSLNKEFTYFTYFTSYKSFAPCEKPDQPGRFNQCVIISFHIYHKRILVLIAKVSGHCLSFTSFESNENSHIAQCRIKNPYL